MMISSRIRDPETARDLTQEALVAALTALRRGDLREPSRLAAFVYGLGRNIANNHLRRVHARPVEVPLEADVMPAPDADESEETERREIATGALDALSPSDRQVLTLTLVEGLGPGEIAGKLGESAQAIRTRKSRALKRVIAEVQRLSRLRPGHH